LDINSLYLLVLVDDEELKSLRDLTSEHLPLLKDIRRAIGEVVPKKYASISSKQQLRIFVHYQPTYYHFHVHVTNVELENSKCYIGTSHLLDDIIDNIEILGSYYQIKTMHYTMGTETDLYSLFMTQGL
jgi:m7GpppX diphosphatase